MDHTLEREPLALNGTMPKQQHTYSVRILHKDRLVDWRWMPHALHSVVSFCQQYEHEADPAQLVQVLQQAFITDDPGMIILAFFKDNDFIGHMLADRSLLYFKPIVTVHQYLLTHGIPAATRHEAIRLVKDWGRQAGAESVQYLVRSKELATMYKRFFGATTHRLIMRTAIEAEE